MFFGLRFHANHRILSPKLTMISCRTMKRKEHEGKEPEPKRVDTNPPVPGKQDALENGAEPHDVAHQVVPDMLNLVRAQSLPPTASEIDKWTKVLTSAMKAVVSIEVCSVLAFDGDDAGTSEGTGFVVDSKRGIILTNRHIVTTGPVMARALFQSQYVRLLAGSE